MRFKTTLPTVILLLLQVCCKEKEDPLPAPEIVEVSPTTGQPGTIVKIKGLNFLINPTSNGVTFNGVKATVKSATDTELTVVAPSGATRGAIEVKVGDHVVAGPEFKFYDLFCYGMKSNKAAWWKNGVPTSFAESGYILDLAIEGSDVHAIGMVHTAGPTPSSTPTYWSNGTVIPLGLPANFYFKGIAAAGTDFYISGVEFVSKPGYKRAWYAKNGKVVFSTDGTAPAEPFDIAISGNDVYLAGEEYPQSRLWKNGSVVNLPNSSLSNRIVRVRIIDSDVHVLGHWNFMVNGAIWYWKNGVQVALKSDGLLEGVPMDMAVDGSDILIGGFFQETDPTHSYFRAMLWKNGVGKALTQGGTDRYVESIEVTDDAIYVLHNEFGMGFPFQPYYSVLLKNDEVITPEFGSGVTGVITGMFVRYY